MFNAKKLLLVTAIAAISSSAFAMEALDDDTMAKSTGQDGIDITLATNLTAATVYIHDVDGIPAEKTGYGTTDKYGNVTVTDGTKPNYTLAGAIVMSNVGISGLDAATDKVPTAALIKLGIDAGASSSDSALHIDLTLGDTNTDTKINLGNVGVARSNKLFSPGSATSVGSVSDDWGVAADGGHSDLINLGSLILGQTTLSIELGSEPQGAMLVTNAEIKNGINLAQFSVTDAYGVPADTTATPPVVGNPTGGSIFADNIQVTDHNDATKLTAHIRGDIDPTGLVINLDQLGTVADGVDVRISGLGMGTKPQYDATSGAVLAANQVARIGDVELLGLQMSGTTLTISGHGAMR